jgi:hypothetical protein
MEKPFETVIQCLKGGVLIDLVLLIRIVVWLAFDPIFSVICSPAAAAGFYLP